MRTPSPRKISTYISAYDMHDSEDLIISIVVAWEQGQKLTRIVDQFTPKMGNISTRADTRGPAHNFIKKIVRKYGVNDLATSLKQRREYWEKNNLWEFSNNLRIELYNVIPYHTVIDYKVHSYSNYNADDNFFKHMTQKNMVKYNAQKGSALKRGKGWQFNSFEEWLLWWLQTGKFDQRGVTNDDYQMCRYSDTGPYSWDNVYCDTGKSNKAAYYQKNAPKKPV